MRTRSEAKPSGVHQDAGGSANQDASEVSNRLFGFLLREGNRFFERE
jgi:hypothetical protein